MIWATILGTLVAIASCRTLADPSSPVHNLAKRQNAILPSSFTWSSTGPLVYPKNDTRSIAGLKDPSIVRINGTYHVFASIAKSAGDASYSLTYFNFTDFSAANSAPFFYLDQSAIGTGYRAAPEVFYFEPHKLWYLIYQNGNAAYSTNKNINDPAGWSKPTNFYNGTPQTITDNLTGGYWVDMWVICDAVNCHLFSSNDNGHLYRSQTPVSSFPANMSEPVIVMSETNKFDLYEASNVYNLGNGTYLLLVECISSAGDRYFRSWTSSKLEGPWTELAASEQHPFMGAANVVFESNATAWTKSFSHGEVIRTILDQSLTIRPCGIQYLYQGVDPGKTNVTYNDLPWRLGLLTQTDSGC